MIRWEEICTAHVPLIITDQRNHAVHQRDVLVLQTLHVSDDVGLRMVAGERKEPACHLACKASEFFYDPLRTCVPIRVRVWYFTSVNR